MCWCSLALNRRSCCWEQRAELDDLGIDKRLEVTAKPADDITLLMHGIDERRLLAAARQPQDKPSSGWRSNRPVAIRKAILVTVRGLVDLTDGPYQCGLNEVHDTGLLPFLKMPKRVEGRRLECEGVWSSTRRGCLRE